MEILYLVLGFYVIITGMAIITSVARFLASSKEEREMKKKVLKKLLEQTEKAGQVPDNNSLMGKIINIKISGIKEDNIFKVLLFNFIMHFVPIINIGIIVSNTNDVLRTFLR